MVSDRDGASPELGGTAAAGVFAFFFFFRFFAPDLPPASTVSSSGSAYSGALEGAGM